MLRACGLGRTRAPKGLTAPYPFSSDGHHRWARAPARPQWGAVGGPATAQRATLRFGVKSVRRRRARTTDSERSMPAQAGPVRWAGREWIPLGFVRRRIVFSIRYCGTHAPDLCLSGAWCRKRPVIPVRADPRPPLDQSIEASGAPRKSCCRRAPGLEPCALRMAARAGADAIADAMPIIPAIMTTSTRI